MKTVSEINQEINDITRSLNKDSSEKEVKSAKARVTFLRMCLRYVETSPREESLKSQLAEINRRIELLPTHYEGWKTGKVLTAYKDPYKTYCSQMELSSMNAQIETLQYILG